MTSVADALVKTQIFSWRGISCPIAGYSTDFSHDIAQHKKPDRDGARLEETGRNPITFVARCLFHNGIVFDLSANTSEPLFPNVHKQFLLACADGSTDDLIHPTLGVIRAKCASYKETVTADRRGGADVDATFVEDAEGAESSLGIRSPLAFMTFSASDLDSKLNALKIRSDILARSLKANRISSFADALRGVRATSDSIALLSRRLGAVIPKARRDLENTGDALERMRDVTAAAARLAVERLKAALFLVEQTQLVKASVVLFTTKTDQTLGALAGSLKTPVTDLVRLNPRLIGTHPPLVVRAGTVVRYYR